MKTQDELEGTSSAYNYGYQDVITGAVPFNLWAGDPEYKWAADDYEKGCKDGYADLETKG